LGFEVSYSNRSSSQAGKSYWEQVGEVHGVGEILGGLIIVSPRLVGGEK
jgi:hypothetical protein